MDLQIANLLAELDALGLSDRTIIVFTSDHGEAAGAHGLHGKGPFAYEEGIHIPLVVHHPDLAGEQSCRALTSHIDIVPTILAFAGVSDSRKGELAGRDLPGKNLMPVLGIPASADLHAARDGVLFTYSGLVANDAELIAVAGEAIANGKSPLETMKASGYQPNLKRGAAFGPCSMGGTNSPDILPPSTGTDRRTSRSSTKRMTSRCSTSRRTARSRSISLSTVRRMPT